jgi:uncharacterized membrane protein YqjE
MKMFLGFVFMCLVTALMIIWAVDDTGRKSLVTIVWVWLVWRSLNGFSSKKEGGCMIYEKDLVLEV